ncbi:hypothetical protein HanXRQr2_Chr11g0486221 [Helianthus annuus]|uniref:Uncharacterized protein n=1 Tax=Helianthus annuus TaxID=4232 RepID=A0A9K3HNL5_HELAN|nr:hypothetical protein HanXRQr2_Chr11g0486221 [Helianthus annuus]
MRTKRCKVLLFLWRREPICQRYDLLIYQLPYSWILIHSFSSQSLSLPNLNLCSIDRDAESCKNRSSTSAIFILPLIYSMALSNQQTVDYLSFKLVIVGDGGTGKLFEVLFCFNNIDIRGEFMWLFGCKYFVMWKGDEDDRDGGWSYSRDSYQLGFPAKKVMTNHSLALIVKRGQNPIFLYILFVCLG